mmetsp:Transcript_18066/g.41638  ORF Transcript_18066/g.41638 Transcript_18066/m.41638 type:complete len:83 (+) Transcript_18066:213-461(+)
MITAYQSIILKALDFFSISPISTSILAIKLLVLSDDSLRLFYDRQICILKLVEFLKASLSILIGECQLNINIWNLYRIFFRF